LPTTFQDLVLDPDEQVANAFRLVFSLFEQFGSALAVTRQFNAQGLKFPTRTQSSQSDELSWQALEHSWVRAILHNPFYAGAYVYGQIRQTKTVQTQASALIDAPKKRLTRLKPADWPIVLLDQHPGYFSWEQYLGNLKQLDQNRTYHFEDRLGAVREGAALLQGLIHCGKCGKRLRVAYRGKSPAPVYVCNEQKLRLGTGRCQEMRGDGIDKAVAEAFLQALQPAQLEISLAVLIPQQVGINPGL
jgi:Recombinase/Recombinase zinc beta ribbon domain